MPVACIAARQVSIPSPTSSDPDRLALVRAEIAERDHGRAADRLALARQLAARRQSATGSIVETYLRDIRAYGGPIPSTLGFLPRTKWHPPAMIAMFGLADEGEPGTLSLAPDRVVGVHLTPLRPDGRAKAGNPAKIMIGRSVGFPIVLSPPNESLALVIAEGIETGLSIAQATGCGVWAAGVASRMPALAAAVPAYIDTLTIAGEPDAAGRKATQALAAGLRKRGLHVEIRILGSGDVAKAA